jgi:hypothetical protein
MDGLAPPGNPASRVDASLTGCKLAVLEERRKAKGKGKKEKIFLGLRLLFAFLLFTF